MLVDVSDIVDSPTTATALDRAFQVLFSHIQTQFFTFSKIIYYSF
jgi:hypothetical protein